MQGVMVERLLLRVEASIYGYCQVSLARMKGRCMYEDKFAYEDCGVQG